MMQNKDARIQYMVIHIAVHGYTYRSLYQIISQHIIVTARYIISNRFISLWSQVFYILTLAQNIISNQIHQVYIVYIYRYQL